MTTNYETNYETYVNVSIGENKEALLAFVLLFLG